MLQTEAYLNDRKVFIVQTTDLFVYHYLIALCLQLNHSGSSRYTLSIKVTKTPLFSRPSPAGREGS